MNTIIEGQLEAATTDGQILAMLARFLETQRIPAPPPLPTYRQELPSSHEWDVEVRELQETVKELVESPKAPRFTSTYARSQIKRATEALRQEGDARSWQALRTGSWRVVLTVAATVAVAALGWIARTLFQR